MKKKKVDSLCEAVADITQIATRERFRIEDSRMQIALYIEWAAQFESIHKNIDWGTNSPCEYLEAIEYFTAFKLKCYQHDSQYYQWSNVVIVILQSDNSVA